MHSKRGAKTAVSCRGIGPATRVGAIDDLRAIGFSRRDLRVLRPHLSQLADIVALASQVFGRHSLMWFVTPEPRLGNVLPSSLLRDPHNGPNLVKQALLNLLRGRIP